MLKNGQVAATSYALDGEERIIKVDRFMVANVVPGRHLSISFDPAALAALESDAADSVVSVVVASEDSLTAEIATMVLEGEEQFEVLASSDLARLGTVVLGHRPQVAVIVKSPFKALGASGDGHDVAGMVEELTEFIEENSLETYSLVVNDVNRPDLARDVLMAGATGVFSPDSGMQEMFKAIQEVAKGRSYLSPSLARQVFSGNGDGLGSLTSRERQVLKRIALGYTNQECADELFLSVRTVEKHHANIKKRIGARSRREIVSYALKNNVLFSAASWIASALFFI